jgi:hypothetical protein
MSHAEMATVWPGRTRSRSGGPETGWRMAATRAATTSGAAGMKTGSTTVLMAASTSMSSPVSP